jgi:hypothetical protein
MEILNISGAVLILLSGLLALSFSVPRIRKKDYTLLSFGFFLTLYGLRWLNEIPGVATGLGFPYLHSLLTYLMPIPFSAFLLVVLGRGLFGSMFWFFLSTIAYAVFAVLHDLPGGQALSPSINTAVLALWCLVGAINVILIQEGRKTELKVLKITLYFFLLCLAYDNLVVLNVVPWKFRLEHIDILVLVAGMAYVALIRLRETEKQ